MLRGAVTFLSLVIVVLAAAATSETPDRRLPVIQAPVAPGPRPLATTDQIRPFAAVGRLDTGDGFCTGTLIAADLVLTAAHCLFAGSADARRADSDFLFNAGLRNERVSAQRGVRRSFIHPGYAYGAPDQLERVRTDLALLVLDRPIADAGVRPLATGGTASEGDAVHVVSYGEAREHVASLEEDCEVLADDPGVHILSCLIAQGSSGAPVMVRSGSEYRIVSVVSAIAHWREEPVALSAEIDGELALLLAMAEQTSAGITDAGLPQVRTLTGGSDGRGTSGALFVRP